MGNKWKWKKIMEKVECMVELLGGEGKMRKIRWKMKKRNKRRRRRELQGEAFELEKKKERIQRELARERAPLWGKLQIKPELSVKIKRQWDDETLDSRQPSQANWIRQYMEQEEEDEFETWEDDILDENSATKKGCESRSYDVIAKEYSAAWLEAVKAKEKGDHENNEKEFAEKGGRKALFQS